MGLTLIVLNGPGKGGVYELDGQQPEILGRAAEHLRIPDTETSRRHAEIRYEKDTWIIRDLGSTNGTYVNDRRLTGLTELEEGDQILIGRVLLVVGQITDTLAGVTAPPPPPEMAAAPEAALSSDAPAPVAGDAVALDALVGETDDSPLDADEDDLLQVSSAGGEEADEPDDAPLAPGAAEVLDDDADEHDVDDDVDPAALAAFEFGRRSERDAATEETTGQPASDDAADASDEASPAQPEQGFLTGNDEVMEVAEAAVRAERAAADAEAPAEGVDALDDPAAVDSDAEAAADWDAAGSYDNTDDATGLLAVEAEGVEPVAGEDVGPSEAQAPVDDAADAEEEDPLAELAPTSADEANELWPDLDLSEERQGEDTPAGPDAEPEPVLDAEDGGDDTPLSEEHGVGLSSIVPPEERDESPTSILEEVAQTHAPYQQRPAPEPREVASPAASAGGPSAAGRPWADGDDRPLPPQPSRRRRGVLAVLLSCLVIGATVGVGWYADAAGIVDLSTYLSKREAAPARAARDLPDVAPLAQEDPGAPVSPGASSAPSASASPAPPSPPPPEEAAAPPAFREWMLGEAPPELALTAAPRLLGAEVLAGRVGQSDAPAPPRPTQETPAPRASPDLLQPAEPIAAAPPPVPSDDAEEPTVTAAPDTPGAPGPPEAPVAAAPSPAPETVVSATPSDPVPNAAALAAVAPSAAVTAAAPDAGRDDEPAAAIDGDGRRIAFVVNASGSVLDTLAQLVDWTNRSVDALGPEDRFAVLFFRRGEAIEPPPRGLKAATEEAKAELRAWTDLAEGRLFPAGQSDASVALQRALDLNVDEIFIVSDDSLGRGMTGDEAAETLDLMERIISDREVRIHTVQFIYRDPQDMLRRMAQRFGGTYRFVEPDRPTGPDPLEILRNFSAAPAPPPASQ